MLLLLLLQKQLTHEINVLIKSRDTFVGAKIYDQIYYLPGDVTI